MVSQALEKVRARLKRLDWNGAELARRMEAKGVHVASGLVSRWLSGARVPGRERAALLDELLDLDVMRLWEVPAKGKAA